MFVCWFVGLSVFFLSATRHLSTLRRCLRVAERAGAVVAGGPARARAQACTARARASMPYNFSTKISFTDAFQNRTRALVGADLGQLVYTYKRVVCVCWFVCWFVCLLFIGHTTFVHFAALPPSGRESRSRRRGRPCARGGHAHAQREHARACRTTSQRKNRCADAFQKQNRTRARMLSHT